VKTPFPESVPAPKAPTRNARKNFDEVAPQVVATLSKSVFERRRALTEEALWR
jgi:hypothetical protein